MENKQNKRKSKFAAWLSGNLFFVVLGVVAVAAIGAMIFYMNQADQLQKAQAAQTAALEIEAKETEAVQEAAAEKEDEKKEEKKELPEETEKPEEEEEETEDKEEDEKADSNKPAASQKPSSTPKPSSTQKPSGGSSSPSSTPKPAATPTPDPHAGKTQVWVVDVPYQAAVYRDEPVYDQVEYYWVVDQVTGEKWTFDSYSSAINKVYALGDEGHTAQYGNDYKNVQVGTTQVLVSPEVPEQGHWEWR